MEYNHCIQLNNTSEPICAIKVNDETKEMTKHADCQQHCRNCNYKVCRNNRDCPKNFYCARETIESKARTLGNSPPQPTGCIPVACKKGCLESGICSGHYTCATNGERCIPFRAKKFGTIYHTCTSVGQKVNKGLWCATEVDEDLVYKKNKYEWCYKWGLGSECQRGLDNYISKNSHRYATDNNIEASKVAFGSCIKPHEAMKGEGEAVWKDVRNYKPDVWLWLGDNTYDDTDKFDDNFFVWDTGTLRMQYNRVREHESYVKHGLVAEDENGTKIPVMGVWDDHDSNLLDTKGGNDNSGGKDAQCLTWNQDEFIHHFNIPNTDPMHQDFKGGSRQIGVYNARMFLKPGGTKEPGIHVILIDVRVGRDNTLAKMSNCQGVKTQQLSNEQWEWLDKELSKKSEVKIIGSPIQVLTPTNQHDRNIEEYCSHDIHSNPKLENTQKQCYRGMYGDITEFCRAIYDIGEDSDWLGTEHESWAQIPQQRKKLLQKAQMSINNGNAKVVIFVSGDQHWGEIMAKQMPPIPNSDKLVGRPQMLYEVTASGIYQHWSYDVLNSNRFKEDVFENIGYYSNLSTTCSNSRFHTCTSKTNYGAINVDFTKRIVRAGIKTPYDGNEEAYVDIFY